MFYNAVTLDLNQESSAQRLPEDLVWILAQQHHTTNETVPARSAFNQVTTRHDMLLTTDEQLMTMTLFYNIMNNCIQMTKKLGQTCRVITFDEKLDYKAKMLQWHNHE